MDLVDLCRELDDGLVAAQTSSADADDDMVLELAFAGGCRYVVTHNVKDAHGSEQLGVTAITPRDFLSLIRART